jgi:hypothetical protein
LIEEEENRSRLSDTKSLDVEAIRTSEDIQKAEIYAPNKEEGIHLNPRRESQ